MRITFVVSYLELTGGHLAVVEIGNRLVDRGHEVLLAYPARSILSRRNEALRRAGTVAPDRLLGPLYRKNGAVLDWAEFRGSIHRVPDLEDRWAPPADVVVATAWQTAERVARWGPRAGRKVYFIQHYETWSGPVDRVDATWRAPFLRVATSEWLRELAAERFGIDDVVVIPYGVDLAAFYPDPPPGRSDRMRVGLLYHVEPWKGITDALEAVKEVAATRPLELVAFGAFEPRGDLPAGTEVHVRPPRDELRRLYSSLDVFLCASWTETGPMTVPEAMACETCVVSTDVGNVSLWTGNGKAAFLAPPRRPDELAAALVEALDDPVERGRRARLGRELIQEFTWDRAAAEFARVLEEGA